MAKELLYDFLKRQNKRLKDFPDGVRETITERLNKLNSGIYYYSKILKDEKIGLIEEVYGAKKLRGEVLLQKLVIIPENEVILPLVRNCYYTFWGMGSGFHSYGYNGKGVYTSYTAYEYNDKFDFADEDFPVRKIRRVELFDSKALEELDSSLKFNSYNKSAEIFAIDYIPLFRRYPAICETLMKLGIEQMFTEKALETINKNKSLAIWLSRHHEEVKHMAFQTAFNSFKKNPNCDPNDYLSSLIYRIECGRAASFSNKEVYKKALLHTSQERIASYLEDNNIGKELYGDYLTACDWLRLDFSDTKVLFPKNFMEVHDLYVGQLNEFKKEQEKKKAEKEFKDISDKMNKTAQKFSFLGTFKDSNYCIVIATSKDDLIKESEALKHCVGHMSYDKRQANEESIICFVRKIEDISTPFVTAEVKINRNLLTVAQYYGFKNRLAPEVADFIKHWMAESNKAYKKIA